MDAEKDMPEEPKESTPAEATKPAVTFTPQPRNLPRRTVTEGGAPVTGVQTGILIEPRKWSDDGEEPAAEVAAAESSEAVLPNVRDARMVQVHEEKTEKPEPFAERLPAAGFQPRRSKTEDEQFHHWGGHHHHHRLSWHWIAIAVGCVIGVVFTVYHLQVRGSKAGQSAPAVAAAAVLQEKKEEPVPFNADDLEMKSDQMFFRENPDQAAKEGRELLLRYARAQTAAEALECIRDRDRLRQLFLQEWRPWGGGPNWEPGRGTVVGLSATGPSIYLLISGSVPGSDEPYVACMIRKGNQMQLDWEATYGVCSPSFKKLLEGEGQTAVARVKLELATFYTAQYPESEFQSFILTGAGSDELLWGFVPRNKPVCQQLLQDILKKKEMGRNQAERYTLRLKKGSLGVQKNQWLIEDVLYRDWVKP